MEMVKVMKCEVNDCAYNMDDGCHTMVITIGDSMNPRCDTFCLSSMKGGDTSCLAGVGACKISSCTYNNNLECEAPGISIGYKEQEQEPDCMTFQS